MCMAHIAKKGFNRRASDIGLKPQVQSLMFYSSVFICGFINGLPKPLDNLVFIVGSLKI